jgi:hypothetical protein
MAARRRTVSASVAFVVVASLVAARSTAAQPQAEQSLTPEQQEQFLKTAKVVRAQPAGKGVTGTLRATLSNGDYTHEASIQNVDISMTEFRSNRGTELNFKDSWRYNVAAYRLNRLLQLGNVPVTVERSYNGKPGAFTWWVDDVLMDEGQRLKTKGDAPDPLAWNQQMWHVRLFDQLIQNVDRNLGNLLIDRGWGVWMIDHSRAFRLSKDLKSPKNLTRIERGAFERLKTLDLATLDAAVGNYLTSYEKRAILERRDRIVELFEQGGRSMIYDRPAQQQ